MDDKINSSYRILDVCAYLENPIIIKNNCNGDPAMKANRTEMIEKIVDMYREQTWHMSLYSDRKHVAINCWKYTGSRFSQ